MASTALTETEAIEYFDEPDALETKIKKLADLIRTSKHFVAFTGAGISTSAGIADFRSGANTVLDTGAGAWTRKAAANKGKHLKAGKRKVSTLKAYPTAAHMALVALMKESKLKYLISQNTDGLHRRSGINVDLLSELHGNSTLEICDTCKKEYMRDYRCSNKTTRRQAQQLNVEEKVGRYKHRTGRICTVKHCGGNLCDTVVSFGEHLPFDPLAIAQQHSQRADLYLSLGSSLAVTPACDMPKDIGLKWMKQKKKNKAITHHLVIVNLQKTPLHDKCSLPIFAKIDDVMIGVMKELNIDIPSWFLQRFLKIDIEIDEKGRRLSIGGIDADGTSFQVFKKIWLKYNGKRVKHVSVNDNEYQYNISVWDKDKILEVELEFFGNYNETNLLITLNEYLGDVMDKGGYVMLKMMMDPHKKTWNTPSIWNINDGMDLKSICLMKLYKTSYGYDGKNAILFANNKLKTCLPPPQIITEYITSTKHNVTWIEGKTGKEDLAEYTAFYHDLGLLFCYFYDYYVPQIKTKTLKKTYQELYPYLCIDEEVLCLICEYEGICTLFNDFMVSDYFNPPPFYQNLIIKRMFANIDDFPLEWKAFINKYSEHRQIND